MWPRAPPTRMGSYGRDGEKLRRVSESIQKGFRSQSFSKVSERFQRGSIMPQKVQICSSLSSAITGLADPGSSGTSERILLVAG